MNVVCGSRWCVVWCLWCRNSANSSAVAVSLVLLMVGRVEMFVFDSVSMLVLSSVMLVSGSAGGVGWWFVLCGSCVVF